MPDPDENGVPKLASDADGTESPCALSEDELAYQRLMLVQDQINKKLPLGIKRKILCPYCGHWNVKGRQLCCDVLRRAVICILSGRRALQVAEAEERARAN